MTLLTPEKQQQAKEIGVLRKLIIEGDKAFADPDTAQALMLQKRAFKDDLIRFACSSMLLHDGDWREAREAIRMNRDVDQGRATKLIAWGDTVFIKERK